MAFTDFFKKKKKEDKFNTDNIEVPPAPPTSSDLPDVPSAESTIKPIEKEPRKNSDIVEKEEDYAVRLQREELGEREDLDLKKPIFVEIELYKDMVEEIGIVKNILKENSDTLIRVEEFNKDEDKSLNAWQKTLVDIQRKLIYVDKTLFAK